MSTFTHRDIEITFTERGDFIATIADKLVRRTSLSAMKMNVDKNPCTSCPYRRDTPHGVWDATEYAKLPAYDTDESFATFLCHHSPFRDGETACRGWLTVHADSIAVRLAMCAGKITPEQRDAKVTVPLFRTGLSAATAGMRGVNRPGRRARQMIAGLLKRKTAETPK